MIRGVFEYPSSILGRKMPEVSKSFGPALYPLLTDLRDTLFAAGAVGLAANQIGIELQVCVVLIGNERLLEFVNPVILSRSGKIYSPEACLSIPDYVAIVPRSKEVKIGYRTRDGKQAMLSLADQYAIRAQHEIDHLNGILIRDYVEGNNGKSGGIDAMAGTIKENKDESVRMG